MGWMWPIWPRETYNRVWLSKAQREPQGCRWRWMAKMPPGRKIVWPGYRKCQKVDNRQKIMTTRSRVRVSGHSVKSLKWVIFQFKRSTDLHNLFLEGLAIFQILWDIQGLWFSSDGSIVKILTSTFCPKFCSRLLYIYRKSQKNLGQQSPWHSESDQNETFG